MIVLLFSLLTLTFLAIYFGYKKVSFSLFSVTMVLFVSWFAYHSTDTLNINL